MGKNCEIVVHDFSDLSSSLVHVSGNITQRQIGAPITDFIYKAYKDEGNTVADICGYKTIFNGRVMKSSTTFLRNSSGEVVGCMCINLDMTDFLNAKALLEEWTNFSDKSVEPSEKFPASFQEMLDSMLEEAVVEIGKQPGSMNKEERLEFITMLNRRDLFAFKGAVNEVARLLGVTRYTIYNDLKEIKDTNDH
jgi:predicted transcriptional regulator YheO